MQTILTELEPKVKEVFPQSFVSVKESKFLGQTSVWLTFTLGAGQSEYSNGIINNDDFHTTINITPAPGNDFSVESNSAGSFSVKPNKEDPKEKFLAYGRIKTPWRNFKSHSEEAVIQKIVTYFIRVKELIRQHEGRLTNESLVLAKQKGYLK